MSKTSNLNLYSSDNLEEKCLHVVSVDAKLSMTTPNVMELSAPSFALVGQTTSAHDISDVGLYLKTLSDLQASESTTQSAAIASNTTHLSTLDAREAADHSAQAGLLGAETARASTAEAALQTALDSEQSRAEAAESVNASAVVSETNRATSAESALQTAIDVEKARIDGILAGADINLDTFLEVATAFEGADTSILLTIGAIQTQLTALQATVDELTA